MRPTDVTLSENARRLCDRLGYSEEDVKRARAKEFSRNERPDYLIVLGELPDGRRARMMCGVTMPHHVVTWRPL